MAPKAILLLLLLLFLLEWPEASNSLHPSKAYPAYFDELEEEDGPLLLQSLLAMEGSQAEATVIDVDDYGAKGDGGDDSLAFGRAWKAACSSSSPASLMVPKNKTYLLQPVTFSGPCKSAVSVMIEGTVEAPSEISGWRGKNQRLWILFNHAEGLTVAGGGTVNGNGEVWWQKSCKIDKSQPCMDAPTALTFRSCNGLTVENLSVKNSQQIHVKFENCSNVTASALTIAAPETSPNTDGIHVSETKNMQISDCVIGTGDDCISIVSGSQDVRATNITCGPGHGISIGSLGEKNSRAQVSGVTVDTARLSGTTNGVRIKTWQGGKGYAKNIIFENIDMHDVQNPIIIDQSYCDSKKKCKQQKSAVQVSNVQYKSIKGTSATKIAMSFNCSGSFPCSGIALEDINLVLGDGGDGGSAESYCRNVEWGAKGTVTPPPCGMIGSVVGGGGVAQFV